MSKIFVINARMKRVITNLPLPIIIVYSIFIKVYRLCLRCCVLISIFVFLLEKFKNEFPSNELLLCKCMTFFVG